MHYQQYPFMQHRFGFHGTQAAHSLRSAHIGSMFQMSKHTQGLHSCHPTAMHSLACPITTAKMQLFHQAKCSPGGSLSMPKASCAQLSCACTSSNLSAASHAHVLTAGSISFAARATCHSAACHGMAASALANATARQAINSPVIHSSSCSSRPAYAPMAAPSCSFWTIRPSALAEPQVLYTGFSQYNQLISVLQFPNTPIEGAEELTGATVLMLDRTKNLHSVWHKDTCLTKGYWDLLATLPAFCPTGSIGILGLGAGTIPRLIHENFPERAMHGWELDPGVVMAGRLFFGMEDIERTGKLVSHTGDALMPDASISAGFAGIIVDLFSGGELIAPLTKVEIWRGIRDRLSQTAPSRVIANLGHSPPSVPGVRWAANAYTTLRAFEAMDKAFKGEVCLVNFGNNTIALTGPVPDAAQLRRNLPPGLKHLAPNLDWSKDLFPFTMTAVGAASAAV